MSRGGVRFGEAEFQQLVARTRGVATSVGGPAPGEARVIAPAPSASGSRHPVSCAMAAGKGT